MPLVLALTHIEPSLNCRHGLDDQHRGNLQVDTHADYAGCKDTFKSTFGGAQFLGEKLISWSSKNKTVWCCQS
nr:retrovirus-related Pol polyprotein from transposon TNT 1-94 [Tanacetum cinerariifolium]